MRERYRKSRVTSPVRFSDKERIIVRYITERLEMAYRDSAGKPVYARSMDQVMYDIFGMKKFTKTLTRARFNEGLMINLMKTLDTETLWTITRSNEHYRLLCTLVAMDHYIVKLGKKYNRMAETDLAERPTTKMRKISKEIKRCKKLYRECVKTFRGIFDIEKVDKRGNGLFDSLEEWLERHDGADDIFYGYGDYYDTGAIESMDEYVASHSKKKNSRGRSSSEGALGVFSNGGSFMDGDDYLEEDDGEEEDETDYLVRKVAERLGIKTDEEEDEYGYGDSGRESDSEVNALNRLITVMTDGFQKLDRNMSGLYDILTEDDDGGEADVEDVTYSIPRPNRYARPESNGPKAMSIGDMIDMSEASNPPMPPDGGTTTTTTVVQQETVVEAPPKDSNPT